jgi:hypothetical protein
MSSGGREENAVSAGLQFFVAIALGHSVRGNWRTESPRARRLQLLRILKTCLGKSVQFLPKKTVMNDQLFKMTPRGNEAGLFSNLTIWREKFVQVAAPTTLARVPARGEI